MLTPSSRASQHYALTSAPNAKFKLGYILSAYSKKLRQNIPGAGIVYSYLEQQAANDTFVIKIYVPSHLDAGGKEPEQQWNRHYSLVYNKAKAVFPCMHHFTFTYSSFRKVLLQFIELLSLLRARKTHNTFRSSFIKLKAEVPKHGDYGDFQPSDQVKGLHHGETKAQECLWFAHCMY